MNIDFSTLHIDTLEQISKNAYNILFNQVSSTVAREVRFEYMTYGMEPYHLYVAATNEICRRELEWMRSGQTN